MYLHHFVRLHETMLDSFLQAHARTFFVFECTDIERESPSFLLDFRKYRTRVFHLQLVCYG